MAAITVTATQSGSTANGMIVRVRVLTRARPAALIAAGTCKGTQAGAAGHSVALTTTVAGSIVWCAMENGNAGANNPVGGNSSLDDIPDATNAEQYGTIFQTTPTVTPGAFTSGSADSFNGGCASIEILPAVNGVAPTTDGSSPALAQTFAATTLMTASFNPPSGALLMAVVVSNGAASTVNMTVTDTSGLVWTEAIASHTANNRYSGIWLADVPVADLRVLANPGKTWRRRYRRLVVIPSYPEAVVSGDATVTAVSADGVSTVPTPAISAGSTVSPATVTGSATIPAPAIPAGPAVVLGVAAIPAPGLNSADAPPVVLGSATIPAPAISAGSTVSVAAVLGSASVPTPAFAAGAVTSPSAVAGSTTVSAPGISSADQPSAVAGSATVPAPGISTGSTASVSAVLGVASVLTPAISTGSTVTGSTVNGTGTIPTPAVSAGGNAQVPASAVLGSATIPAPGISSADAPGVVLGAATIPAPAISSADAPSAVLGLASVPAPIVLAGSVVAPAAVTGSAAVPAPGVSAGAQLAAVAVLGVASIPAPSVSAGGNAQVTASVVLGSAAIPAPGVSAGSAVAASAVAGLTTIPAPAVTTVTGVLASVVLGSATVPAPGVRVGSVLAAVSVLGAASVPLPVVFQPVTFVTLRVAAKDVDHSITSGEPTDESIADGDQLSSDPAHSVAVDTSRVDQEQAANSRVSGKSLNGN